MYISVDHPLRSCLWCGLLFKPVRSHQNFCTKTCYKRYGKKHLGHSQGRPNRDRTKQGRYIYRKHKGFCCSICGFLPEDPCQLDVHHIDGVHDNNCVTNLLTVCANCHRLLTKREKHGIYR